MRALAARDEEAVADILGSILMVGITVIMAAAFAILLFSYKGPTPTLQTDVAVSVDPGAGGWSTGDETIRILHRGGDPLSAIQSTVTVKIGAAAQQSYTGATALGSTFADGKLTVGEIWQKTYTIASGSAVTVKLIAVGQGSSQLLAANSLVANAISSVQPCATDTAFPTVLVWTQSPSIITGSTTGPVTITARLTDDCWGVNPNVVPDLFWRITPTVPYTDEGAMSPAGSATWTGTVPAQTWSSLVGQTLQYHIGPVSDLGPNTGTTPDRTSTIALNCNGDITPPTGTLSQNPADIKTTTSGAITIGVVEADDCAGVDQTTNPHIFYRFNSGSNPAYTDSGPMTKGATSTWSGTIPSQSWPTLVGQTVEYYVTGMRDLNGNLGTTAVAQDVVDGVFLYNYVTSNTPTTGTVSVFANAQSASDSGAEATIAEGAVPSSSATQIFGSSGVVLSLGWTASTGTVATAVAGSDTAYALFAGTCTPSPCKLNDLKVALADPASTSGTVTSVVLKAEASIPGDSNDGFAMQGCILGGSCTAYSGVTVPGAGSTDVTLTYDITAIKPGCIGCAWTLTDITNLQAAIDLTQNGGHATWKVNYVYVQVTFFGNSYSTNVQFGFTGVPAGTTHTLEIRHRVTGDTFNVQVCQDALVTCATWTTRGSSLTAATATTYTYALTALEYNAGAPRIRFTDATSSTTQGNLFIDYARVSTV